MFSLNKPFDTSLMSRLVLYPLSSLQYLLNLTTSSTIRAPSSSKRSRSASLTEDHGSNAALTEDDLSSDAHTTDVSRTSSFVAGGSSFEESLAQTQAASGHFLNISRAANNPPSSSIDDDMDTNNDSANASVAAAGGGSNNLSSLAERLARAEETVAREHEKGLLYRQGPEGVAAAVVGEDLAPLPPLDPSTVGGAPDRAPRGGDSGGGDMGGGGGGWSEDEEQEEVQSLANMLARADDGPGNLKDAFQLVSFFPLFLFCCFLFSVPFFFFFRFLFVLCLFLFFLPSYYSCLVGWLVGHVAMWLAGCLASWRANYYSTVVLVCPIDLVTHSYWYRTGVDRPLRLPAAAFSFLV